MTIFIENNKNLLDEIRNNNFTSEVLNLSSEECTDEDIAELVIALNHNSHIKQIILADNYITDTGAIALASLLRKGNCNIRVVDLSANIISETGAHALAQGRIEMLNLNGNPIGDTGISSFVDTQGLRELHVSECGISDNGAAQILKSKTLKKLDLSMNQLTDSALQNIDSNAQLEELNLDQNSIGSIGAGYLSNQNSLLSLSLAKNKLGSEGLETLTKGNGLASLKTLDLSENGIEELGAIALGEWPINLEHLILLNNTITLYGASKLFQRKNFELNLAFNNIQGKLADVILAYQNNISINVENNPIAKAIKFSSDEQIQPQHVTASDITAQKTKRK